MSAIKISNNGLKPTSNVEAYDSNGDIVQATVAGELPLTVKLNNIEIVTLMTLGTRPEELALGYLRNQNIISDLDDVKSINVDWKKEIAEVLRVRKHGRHLGLLGVREAGLWSVPGVACETALLQQQPLPLP